MSLSLSVSNRGLEIHGHGMFPPPPRKVSLKHDIDVNIPMEETDEAEKKEQKATAVQRLAGRRLERRGA